MPKNNAFRLDQTDPGSDARQEMARFTQSQATGQAQEERSLFSKKMPETSHNDWPKTSKSAYQMAESGDVTIPDDQPERSWKTEPIDAGKTKSSGRTREATIGAVVMTIVFVSAAVAIGLTLMTNKKPAAPKQVVFVGSMVIKEDWKDVYGNEKSVGFKRKKSSIETKLNRAFQTAETASIYNSTTVTGLRPGSIITDFKVVINMPPGGVQLKNGTVLVTETSGSRDDVASLIRDAIVAEDSLNVDKDRIQVHVLQDGSPSPLIPMAKSTTLNPGLETTIASSATTSTLSAPTDSPVSKSTSPTTSISSPLPLPETTVVEVSSSASPETTRFMTTDSASVTSSSASVTSATVSSSGVTSVTSSSASVKSATVSSSGVTSVTSSSVAVKSATVSSAGVTSVTSSSASVKSATVSSAGVTSVTSSSASVKSATVSSSGVTSVTSSSASVKSATVSSAGVTSVTSSSVAVKSATSTSTVFTSAVSSSTSVTSATSPSAAITSPISAPISTDGAVNHPNDGQDTDLIGRVVLADEWLEALLNRSSPAYVGLVDEFRGEIVQIFNGTLLSDRLRSVDILTLRPGSVIITFKLRLARVRIVAGVTMDTDPPNLMLTMTEIRQMMHNNTASLSNTYDWDSMKLEELSLVRMVFGASGPDWEFGHPEVLYRGQWARFCGPLNQTTAEILCTSLGYRFAFVGPKEVLPSRRSTFLKHVGCSGSELDIMDCQHGDNETDACEIRENSELHCSNSPLADCGCENGGQCVRDPLSRDRQICKCLYGHTGSRCQYSFLSTPRPWTTRIPGFACRPNVFSCHSGACVPHFWVCDGLYDCPDGSDESLYICAPNTSISIPDQKTSAPLTPWWQSTASVSGTTTVNWKTTDMNSTTTWRQSATTTTTTTERTTETWRVTTSPILPTRRQCGGDRFLCGDGVTCRPTYERCNGYVNCADGSDERGCVEANGTAIRVYSGWEFKPLCGDDTDPDTDNQVGQAICLYLGYQNLKAVFVDVTNPVTEGTYIYPSAGWTHYLGSFQTREESSCAPLNVECMGEVTKCGRPVVPLAANFIQGGINALRGQWPWTVMLKRRGRVICGGSLINRQWVLSAAHCVRGYDHSDLGVVLGSHRRYYTEDSQREFSVVRMVVHGNHSHNGGYNVNDAVLLLLNTSVTFSSYIQPVCLPRRDRASNDLCYIIGWGRMRGNSYADTLQQIRVQTYSNRHCDSAYTLDILDSMICARTFSSYTGYTPSCFGDSGGPLVCLDSVGRWDLHGIVSFSPTNCYSNGGTGFSVLTNVFSVKPWIESVTECLFDCGDGHCLYDMDEICDGAEQCPDGSDEVRLCAPTVSCDFEMGFNCGYNVSTSPGVPGWMKVSVVTVGYSNRTTIYDHTKNTEKGRFMSLHFLSMFGVPAILESPDLPVSHLPSCVSFYFLSYYVRESPSGNDVVPSPPLLQVWSVDSQESARMVWFIDTYFRPSWQQASVTLPPTTRRLRFVGMGHVSIDDVFHTPEVECPATVCDEPSYVRCSDTNTCVRPDMLCDGQRQCKDDGPDENPQDCGMNVNCTFSDGYQCGYQVQTDGSFRWQWRHAVAGVYRDHSDKNTQTYHDTQSNVFVRAMDIEYNLGRMLVDLTRTRLKSNLVLPEITLAANSCLEVYFLSFTNDVTSNFTAKLSVINVDEDEELWARTNSQGTKWRLAQVDLPSGSHNLHIRAEIDPKISHWKFMIDDVSLLTGICQNSIISCSVDEFRCSADQCIPWDLVCDGKDNCANGTDEFDGCTAAQSVRLVGGAPHAHQGRVEIFRHGRWQALCVNDDDEERDKTARATCRSMGYRNAVGTSVHWQGDPGPEYPVIRVSCPGHGEVLDGCLMSGTVWNTGCSDHTKVLAVSCQGYVRYQYVVRLASLSDPWKGRVEINYDNSWRAVCNSGWDETAANITCKMLGYSGAVRTLGPDDLQDLAPMSRAWLSGLRCFGNESYLHECQHDNWYSASCPQSQYVGVECAYDPVEIPRYPTQMRLADGTGAFGRVEILCNDQWGTMCDDELTSTTAERICKELGYTSGTPSSAALPGAGPIWIDDIGSCPRNAPLLDCDIDLGVHDCDHREDAVVSCHTVCDPGQILCRDEKTCVSVQHICDGEPDCPDDDDEENCGTGCAEHQFACKSNRCIPLPERCDGVYQCNDGTDEVGCVQITENNSVEVFVSGNWRKLCVQPGGRDKTAAIVCSMHSLSGVSSSSVRTTSEMAWLVTNTGASVNSSGVGGLNFTSARNCSALYVICRSPQCGQKGTSEVEEHLIGGKEARDGEWPWMVRIRHRSRSFNDTTSCDGVLVNPIWLLTSRDCVMHLRNSFGGSLVVGGGIWTGGQPSWTSPVGEISMGRILNPEGDSYYTRHLYLMRVWIPSLELNDTEPVCLPNEHSTAAARCYVIGWQHDISEMVLQEIRVKYTEGICANVNWPVTSSFLRHTDCLEYTSTGISCYSDGGVGSAVVCRHPSGRWVVEGMTLTRSTCYTGRTVNIPVRVRDFLPWIKENTACPFRCSDGSCLYKLYTVCDGVSHCSSDEGDFCRHVSCNFDYSGACGYTNGQWVNAYWSKASVYSSSARVRDHTRSTFEGAFVHIVKRVQNATSEATLWSPVMTSPLSGCLVFYFVMAGSPALRFDVIGYSANDSVTLLNIRGDFGLTWKKALVQLNSSISLTGIGFAARGMGQSGYVALDDVRYPVENCTLECDADEEFPCGGVCLDAVRLCDGFDHCPNGADEYNCTGVVDCDFEESLCGYENATGGDRWYRARGRSYPPADHTNKSPSGDFLYAIDSSATLLSPRFTLHEVACLEFYYYSWGAAPSSDLRLLVTDALKPSRDNFLFRSYEPLLRRWHLAQVTLQPGSHQISYRVYSDMAVDDVRVVPGHCVATVISCSANEYQCEGTTRCIASSGLCNGQNDCPLEDDERDCPIHGAVRLVPVGQSSAWQGMVQVYVSGVWKLLSETYNWPPENVQVLCGELGFSSIGASSRRMYIPGSVWSQRIRCVGTESSILECPREYQYYSRYEYKVVVSCTPYDPSGRISDHLRLVDGERSGEGRLEVKLKHEWGTVCDDDFGNAEAITVCRSLGYRGSPEILPTVHPGSGRIWLDDFYCYGGLEDLLKCSIQTLGQHDCTHYEDVWVRCNQDCGPGYSLCSDKFTCIISDWVCDGEVDCPDGTDEAGCNTCGDEEFTCKNYTCISADKRCDGIADCQDESDEASCLRLTEENYITIVDAAGTWNILCANASSSHDIAQDACTYLGYSSVNWSRTEVGLTTIYGLWPSETPGEGGLFAGYTLGEPRLCHPLVIECTNLKCGVRSSQNTAPPTGSGNFRGAKLAHTVQWPWQVLVHPTPRVTCDGVLIDRHWVLTPTGCLEPYLRDSGSVRRIKVWLGLTKFRLTNGTTKTERGVLRRISSPTTESVTLLLLSEPVGITEYARPVCLPPNSTSVPSDKCVVTYWEDFGNDDFNSAVLQKSPASLSECGQLGEDNVICRGNEASNRTGQSCTEWSAGLLVCRKSGTRDRWEIVGIQASSLQDQSCSEQPFNTISPVTDWIEDNIACPFPCGDVCLHDPALICDGVDHCPGAVDEGAACEDSVNCTFEYPNLCGYQNVSSVSTSVWAWHSHNTGDAVTDYLSLDFPKDKNGSEHGYYMYVHSFYIGVTPAIVETPDFVTVTGVYSCLQFYAYMKSPNTGQIKLSVLALHGETEASVLNVFVSQFANWTLENAALPPGTHRLRFVAVNITKFDFVAIDDVDVQYRACENRDREGHFRCVSDGRYIPIARQCDHVVNCQDGSDEIGCGGSVTCDFEGGPSMCGYRNENDFSNWYRTAAEDTGASTPDKDHTNKSRQGYFVRTTGYDYRGRSSLVSVPFVPEEDSCLYFYYAIPNRSGSITDALEVYIISNNERRRVWGSGQEVSGKWTLGLVQLTPESSRTEYRIVFQSDQQNYTRSQTVNMDDIRLERGRCNFHVVDCGPEHFQCDTGHCIPNRNQCDGVSHCEDNSDETRGCAQPPSPVRLVDGGYRSQGRVEIFHGGRWGSVCSDGFDQREAEVVCRTLNYTVTKGPVPRLNGFLSEGNASASEVNGTGSVFVFDGDYFNRGPDVVLSQLDCTGEEVWLDQCPGQWQSWCPGSSVASVSCGSPRGIENNVRLTPVHTWHSPAWEGRVEIYHNNSWGSICDHGWDVHDARVVCRMMGLGESAEIIPGYTTDVNSVPFWMNQVDCNGTEDRLEDCPFSGWGVHNCSHRQDVGVRCLSAEVVAEKEIGPAKERVRLVDGLDKDEGRVEMFVEGKWGTVCDDDVTDTEVKVICQTLGYSGSGEIIPLPVPGKGPIWEDELNCHGTVSLFDCGKSLPHDCDHFEDVAVRCHNDPFVLHSAAVPYFRLTGGQYFGEGNLEYLTEDGWYPVCDVPVGYEELICRLFGFVGFSQKKSGIPRLLDHIERCYSLQYCSEDGCTLQHQTARASSRTNGLSCSNTSCPAGTKQCSHLNARGQIVCISQGYVCDGNPDCPHSTDETNCSRCGRDEIICDVNTCLPQTARCDGTPQCRDGSDEFKCLYRSLPDSEFLMANFRGSGYPVCYGDHLKNPDNASLADQICRELGQGGLYKVTPSGTFVTGIELLSLDWSDPLSRSLHPNCELAKIFCQYEECGVRLLEDPDVFSVAPVNMSDQNPSRPRPSVTDEWPWHVDIHHSRGYRCTGVFISPKWVLVDSSCIATPYAWTQRIERFLRISSPPFIYTKLENGGVVEHSAPGFRMLHAVPIPDQTNQTTTLILVTPQNGSSSQNYPACLPYTELPESPMCHILGYTSRVGASIHTSQQEVAVPLVDHFQYNIDSVDPDHQLESLPILVCLNSRGLWEIQGVGNRLGNIRVYKQFTNIQSLSTRLKDIMEQECIYKCRDTGRCLYDHAFLCNGEADCEDMSDEEDALCVTSPNCTFEYGLCGYSNVRPWNVTGHRMWSLVRARADSRDLRKPSKDHSTKSDRGYVLGVENYASSVAYLASPVFSPVNQESCLRFSWHSRRQIVNNRLRPVGGPTRSPPSSSNLPPEWPAHSTNFTSLFGRATNILTVYATVGALTQEVIKLRAADFNREITFRARSATFERVSVTLPPNTGRFHVKFDSGAAESGEAISTYIDDVQLTSGPCAEGSEDCDFEEAGLCGYGILYDDFDWMTVAERTNQSTDTLLNRYVVLALNNTGKNYIASPTLQNHPQRLCLSFSYQIDNVQGGSLAVYTVAGETAISKTDFAGQKVWSVTSAGQHSWRSVKVDLDSTGPSRFRLVFEGQGRGGSGFIRLDDIRLSAAQCQPSACTPNEFRCLETMTCIPNEEKCNSVGDCSDLDLSDETNADCGPSFNCSFHDPFLCGYRNDTSQAGVWIFVPHTLDYDVTPVRLQNTYSTYGWIEGRVEVYHEGQWGTICWRNFRDTELRVLCGMLGYEIFYQYTSVYWYRKVWLTNLSCYGGESDVSQCTHDPWGSGGCDTHSVQVRCGQAMPAGRMRFWRGTLARFHPGSKFADKAIMRSPDLECRSWTNGCSDVCVAVMILGHLETPLTIFSENSTGSLTPLWNSYLGGNVTLAMLPDTVRLQFHTRYTLSAEYSWVIDHVEMLAGCNETCCKSPGRFRCDNGQSVNGNKLCDGLADCADNSDEWNIHCTNTSLSCTFEDGHSCGYAGINRSIPWRVDRVSDASARLDRWYLRNADRNNQNGYVMYYHPDDCSANKLTIQELVFPQHPGFVEGACVSFYYWGTGNFTLTTTDGTIYYYARSFSYRWIEVKAQVPPGHSALSVSLLADCINGFLAIDDIDVQPGSCSKDPERRYCDYKRGFTCGDGKYVPCYHVCNARIDCDDRSDEVGCYCNPNSYARCGAPDGDGLCVPVSHWCNGVSQCPDSSDELPECSCPAGYFSCDGQIDCKPLDVYCNEHIDCPGGEDEPDNCSVSCNTDLQFACDNGYCVPLSTRCDDINTCGDFSDEVGCNCADTDHLCEESDVCIRPNRVCDGVEDCPWGTDEGSQCMECTEDEYKCQVSGFCVDKARVCDGFFDCRDYSDEWNCSNCRGFRCEKSGHCLYNFYRCDGHLNCVFYSLGDYSDEQNCSTSERFLCENGVTILDRYVCDGIDHCQDFSDEKNCSCFAGEWRCDDGKCIQRDFVCDQRGDCEDGSDEIDCGNCGIDQVLSCHGRACLEKSDICDGQFHCEDGVDEQNCGVFVAGSHVQGLVYFKRGESQYPLCAEHLVPNEEVLENLCHYLVYGSYINASAQTTDESRGIFLTYTGSEAENTLNFTATLTLGICRNNKTLQLTCQSPHCGTRPVQNGMQPHVIGGEISAPDTWPWMVRLSLLGKGTCGGSVVQEKWVLTAAHCFMNRRYPAAYIRVHAGSNSPMVAHNLTQVRGIRRIFLYPEEINVPDRYRHTGYIQGDLALVELDSPLDLGDNVRPLCLPDSPAVPENSMCYSAGWGYTNPTRGFFSADLRHFRTIVKNETYCQSKWDASKEEFIDKICVGFDSRRPSNCQGDSGGPLMCLTPQGLWILQGVVSFGMSSCQIDVDVSDPDRLRPDVFTDVSHYKTWINDVINENA